MSISNSNLKCIIRTGTLEDAEAVLAIQNRVVAEGDYLITVSEEFEKTTEEQREWIGRLLANDKETIIVAEIEEKVVGWVVFQSPNRKRLSHTGTLAIALDKEYKGAGIGKMLGKALLEWAERNPLIEKVSLGVFSTNQRALALYKSMGFLEEGRKVKEFKLNEDEYVDDILMYKMV